MCPPEISSGYFLNTTSPFLQLQRGHPSAAPGDPVVLSEPLLAKSWRGLGRCCSVHSTEVPAVNRARRRAVSETTAPSASPDTSSAGSHEVGTWLAGAVGAQLWIRHTQRWVLCPRGTGSEAGDAPQLQTEKVCAGSGQDQCDHAACGTPETGGCPQ